MTKTERCLGRFDEGGVNAGSETRKVTHFLEEKKGRLIERIKKIDHCH